MKVTATLPVLSDEKTNNSNALPDSSLIASERQSLRPAPAYTTRPSISSKAKLILTLVCVALTGYTAFYGPTLRSSRVQTATGASLDNPAHLIEADHGAVATENKRCSDIGVETLKAGGSAVDAAISAALCVGVVNMFASGIGGGGMMVVRLPPSSPGERSEVYTIDFREVAPAAANEHMYSKSPLSARYGGLAVGVPGELLGFEEAHKRWGKLPWADLFQPAINLAHGWEVDRELGRRLPWFPKLMLENEDWSPIFAPGGAILRQGELIKRPNLARTLSLVAERGTDEFYKGSIADALIAKIRSEKGIMTHEDFANYSVRVDKALTSTYKGRENYTVYTTHPPTSGIVLLHMLNILETYPEFLEEGRTGLNVHRLIESMKFGFAARTKVCDFGYKNNSERMSKIPAKEYAAEVRQRLTDDRTHAPAYYRPEFAVEEDHGTTHVSVIDQDGMAVALTSTINSLFGSEVMDPVTGIILNDEMDDFSIPGVPNTWGLYPSPYNFPEPSKRPLSSCVPTILEHEDGSFYLAIGGAGGSQILTLVLQVLIHLDWGLDLLTAVERGRVHEQLYPLLVGAEESYEDDILDDLRARGHNVTYLGAGIIPGSANVVMAQEGKIFAVSDSRKNGIAAGY